jgi:hypothetical protein
MRKSTLKKQILNSKFGDGITINNYYQYVVSDENSKRVAGPFDTETILKYAINGLGSWLYPNPEIVEPDGLQKVVGIGEDFFLISKKNFNATSQIGFCLLTKNIEPIENINDIFSQYKQNANTHFDIQLGTTVAEELFLSWLK